ncbi:hypothetical protein DE4585_04077 [Mycobacteroides salmoniphilum]|uniref:Uncharacterized protein n=1 Tax=Mycobacteroides salmoniphilum TaxID=404941 RepID=A0A4R8RXB7_9MYCO|nr:hypothetical protein DE4585_04077 [Mycobacteroides salmoniphilum]TDZ96322.1 hypothetical protein CCUG60885_02465 [Mycobacteroides salmoniphilum]TEA05417.1 hypothetical protein CCUG60883_02722 [Mycobacteroides salmoniphilum]
MSPVQGLAPKNHPKWVMLGPALLTSVGMSMSIHIFTPFFAITFRFRILARHNESR